MRLTEIFKISVPINPNPNPKNPSIITLNLTLNLPLTLNELRVQVPLHSKKLGQQLFAI